MNKALLLKQIMHSYQVALEGLGNAIVTLVIPHTFLSNLFPGVPCYYFFQIHLECNEELQLLTPASDPYLGDEMEVVYHLDNGREE